MFYIKSILPTIDSNFNISNHITDEDYEKDREWVEWIFNSLGERLRTVEEVQVPHVYVQVLATDPGWQRQGAATILLDWIWD